MADFRCERLFVMLDEPVPGLDHLRAVDPVRFSMHYSDDHAEQLGLTPLSDFTFAPFERARWYAAAEGLSTVRGLCDLYRDWLSAESNPYGFTADMLARKIEVLEQVEAVLDVAAARDRRFHLAAKDLA
jgi:hypothetical protein